MTHRMLLTAAVLSFLASSACEPCMGIESCKDGYTAQIDMVDAPIYSNDGLNPNPPLSLTIDQGAGQKKYGFAPGPLRYRSLFGAHMSVSCPELEKK